MATDRTQLLHALGCIQAAHGCLQGSTIQNAGIIAEYLADAAVTLTRIIAETPSSDLRPILLRDQTPTANPGAGSRRSCP